MTIELVTDEELQAFVITLDTLVRREKGLKKLGEKLLESDTRKRYLRLDNGRVAVNSETYQAATDATYESLVNIVALINCLINLGLVKVDHGAKRAEKSGGAPE